MTRSALVTLLFALVFASVIASGCRPAGAPKIDANTSDSIGTSETTIDKIDPTADQGTDPHQEKPRQGTLNVAETDETVHVAGTKHRFLLFPPDGPLLIELEITVAGRALDGWIDSLLDEAFALADGDKNGQVTWDELFESDELDRRYLSNSSVLDEGLEATKDQYDSNNNDLVDKYELPPILMGTMSTGQSFGLRSSNYYRELNRFASPLFRYLDVDNDGLLNPTEVASAAGRLLSRDFDNDEQVALADLSLADSDVDATRNNGLQPPVAVWLGPRDPWDTIRLALRELYADGEEPNAGDFPLTPDLFGRIDRDSNGRFSLRELAILTELEPHLAIRVELSSDEADSRIFSNVRICESLQAANVTINQSAATLQVLLPKSQVDWFAQSIPFQTAEKRAETLLAQVDTDKNQYIDPDEYEAAEIAWESDFAELDIDENEMIFLDELTSMFPLNQALAGSQVRLRAGHRLDALFSVLDADGNQRLSPQELDQLKGTLSNLDDNEDGAVTADELPDRLMIGLTQGDDRQANNLLNDPPPSGTQREVDAPDWFHSMDHNSDGQLSRREFLGKKGQFESVDANSDGYLSVDELGPLEH